MEAKYSETVASLSDAQKLERKYRQREALANIFTALIDELKDEAFRPFGTGPIEDIQAAVNLSSFEDCCRLKRLPCLEVLQVRLVKYYVFFFYLYTNLLIFRSLRALDVLGYEDS
jgi:hypothetical protein